MTDYKIISEPSCKLTPTLSFSQKGNTLTKRFLRPSYQVIESKSEKGSLFVEACEAWIPTMKSGNVGPGCAAQLGEYLPTMQKAPALHKTGSCGTCL